MFLHLNSNPLLNMQMVKLTAEADWWFDVYCFFGDIDQDLTNL